MRYRAYAVHDEFAQWPVLRRVATRERVLGDVLAPHPYAAITAAKSAFGLQLGEWIEVTPVRNGHRNPNPVVVPGEGA